MQSAGQVDRSGQGGAADESCHARQTVGLGTSHDRPAHSTRGRHVARAPFSEQKRSVHVGVIGIACVAVMARSASMACMMVVDGMVCGLGLFGWRSSCLALVGCWVPRRFGDGSPRGCFGVWCGGVWLEDGELRKLA